MSWIQLTSVTATNNSNVIVVNTGSTVGIKAGDALLLAGFDLVEVEGVFATQLQLRKPWAYATQSSVQAVVVPTFGDFNNAVEEVRNLRKAASDTLNELYANFVEKEEGKGLSTNDLTDELLEDINNKVDKESGKGLSTHDYDNTAKQKVDEMGTAASRNVTTSPADVTPGRLLKVGDYGNGVPIVTAEVNLNAGVYLIPGNYITPSTGVQNLPSGFTQTDRLIVRVSGDAGTLKQELCQRGVQRFFDRSVNGLSFQTAPWRELYHTGNVVAPVSQVGGVPTGGLVQPGSNPNGYFVRLADGTQITTSRIVYPAGERNHLVRTLPTSFIDTSDMQVSFSAGIVSNSNAGSFLTEARVSSVNSVDLKILIATNGGAILFPSSPVTAYLTVIGRWY